MMAVENDGENGSAGELWVENEIGFGWWRSRQCWGATISPMLGCDDLAGAWMCDRALTGAWKWWLELSLVLLFLSLFYFPGMEINCRENKSVKYFTRLWGMIYSQRKSFSVWLNFLGQSKHAQWCKIFSGNYLLPKQTQPKTFYLSLSPFPFLHSTQSLLLTSS